MTKWEALSQQKTCIQVQAAMNMVQSVPTVPENQQRLEEIIRDSL